MSNLHTRSFLTALASTLGATCLAVNVAHGYVLINQSKALAGAVTPGDEPGFPVTLSRRGSYRLSGNLHVRDDASGIEVVADDVTIDLNGFVIRGPGVVGNGDGISAAIGNQGFARLSVSNGIVKKFGRFGVVSGPQARITGLHVEANGFGGIFGLGGGQQGSIVSDNTVPSNGGPGISLLGSGDLVSGNTLWGNRGNGISAGGVAVVKNNAVSSGAGHAISA